MILPLLCVALQIAALECANFKKQLQPTPMPDSAESWTGKWFPHRPQRIHEPNYDVPERLEDLEVDKMVPMGVSNILCDDGKTNLTVDWDGDASDYICLSDSFMEPNFDVRPLLESYNIPYAYRAMHLCMNESIIYADDIPTYGTHRGLWPVFGEYQYVPRQRWLHTLEHGGIVMLYHPCANKYQVNMLRKLVRRCLRRHVITPSNLLKAEKPLALVAWGKRLQMSFVDEEIVTEFIRENALHGPEMVSADGQYSFGLIQKAEIITDIDDTTLCPTL